MSKRGLHLIVVGGLVLLALAVVVSPASAVQPECKVINQSQSTSYSSNGYADPLGAAIAEAASGDTLKVIGTCHGNFRIDKELTLTGRSSDKHQDTLDGSGFDGEVLAVNTATCCSTFRVEIKNLTITHGSLGGLGVDGYFGADAELTNVTMKDNAGPGVTVWHSRATFTDSVISGNDGGIFGGYGAATLIDSVVSGNGFGLGGTRMGWTLVRTEVRDNGGVGLGVGINSSATVSDATLSNNESGGISIAMFGYAQITGSTITDNDGPGIWMWEGSVSLNSSTVTGNTTSDSGGGIDARSGAASLVDSVVSGNNAAFDGGGIAGSVTLGNSTVSGNTAGRNGGGIYVPEYRSAILNNSSVIGNTAAAAGGGIWGPGTAVLNGTSTACGNTPDDYPGCLP